MRALAAMDIHPSAIHMNEGHCTFACLERLSQIMSRHSVGLETALEIVDTWLKSSFEGGRHIQRIEKIEGRS